MHTHKEHISHHLTYRDLKIDTNQELVVFMPANCHVCKSEGFQALTRVIVSDGQLNIIATLNITDNGLLNEGEISLSDSAKKKLGCKQGDLLIVQHLQPLHSMEHIRAKIYGNSLPQLAFDEIISDIADEKYSNISLSSFVTAFSNNNVSVEEICFLTKAMINVGNKLNWKKSVVVDKHCIGGLPGNRTTLIVVPIIASLGITIPKTSSRAITSPAGTADTMEVFTNVNLSLSQMQKVVEKENGCIAWGNAIKLSPADDIIIRVERALDIDSENQMIASILSKKIAAGSTHCVIDIPYGKTAKVRSIDAAHKLAEKLQHVATFIGLQVRTIISDGSQPVGYGIGPSLEARDVLSVLRNELSASGDLRTRALKIATEIIKMVHNLDDHEAFLLAEQQITNGRALNTFLRICESQGGFAEPRYGLYSKTIEAMSSGVISEIDNRKIARLAKLAGAPEAKEAGIDLLTHLNQRVEKTQPLFKIYANSVGELSYAYDYFKANENEIIKITL